MLIKPLEVSMTIVLNEPVSALSGLPISLQHDGAINIELQEGALIFRVSSDVQNRIEDLLHKQRYEKLTDDEEEELQQYEDIDDYLSLLNRLSRNMVLKQNPEYQ